MDKEHESGFLDWTAIKYCPMCGRRPEEGTDGVSKHIAKFNCTYCQAFVQVWVSQ